MTRLFAVKLMRIWTDTAGNRNLNPQQSPILQYPALKHLLCKKAEKKIRSVLVDL